MGSNDKFEIVAVKSTSNNTPKTAISNETISVKFSDGDYSKQEKIDYIRNKIVDIYIVYKLTPTMIDEDGLVLFVNLKIRNTKDTLHYKYYDGIGVFLMLLVDMVELDKMNLEI